MSFPFQLTFKVFQNRSALDFEIAVVNLLDVYSYVVEICPLCSLWPYALFFLLPIMLVLYIEASSDDVGRVLQEPGPGNKA